MRSCLLILLLLRTLLINAQTTDTIHYRVPGKVPVVRQPKDMDCWITITTMLYSWRDKKTYTVSQVADKLGLPWKQYYKNNIGLPSRAQDSFINVTKLRTEPPANYTLEAYLELLQKHGPLWITTGDGWVSAHARLLIGMEGRKGDYANTSFIFIDPFEGKVVAQKGTSFFAEFEEEAKEFVKRKLEFRLQIIHF